MSSDFYSLFHQPDPTLSASATVTPLDPARATRYATRAFEEEVAAAVAAHEGTRNHTLNRAAFSLGQFVVAGHLHHDDVHQALTAAARAAGLDDTETQATIASGLASGAETPRVFPDQAPVPDVTILAAPVDTDGHNGETPPLASWAPVQLDDVLDGTYSPGLPTLLPRTDDAHLLYPRRVHSFHGEFESGSHSSPRPKPHASSTPRQHAGSATSAKTTTISTPQPPSASSTDSTPRPTTADDASPVATRPPATSTAGPSTYRQRHPTLVDPGQDRHRLGLASLAAH